MTLFFQSVSTPYAWETDSLIPFAEVDVLLSRCINKLCRLRNGHPLTIGPSHRNHNRQHDLKRDRHEHHLQRRHCHTRVGCILHRHRYSLTYLAAQATATAKSTPSAQAAAPQTATATPATKAAHTSATTPSLAVSPAQETAIALRDKRASTTPLLHLVAAQCVCITRDVRRAIRPQRGGWNTREAVGIRLSS